jgi:hypothetical protein
MPWGRRPDDTNIRRPRCSMPQGRDGSPSRPCPSHPCPSRPSPSRLSPSRPSPSCPSLARPARRRIRTRIPDPVPPRRPGPPPPLSLRPFVRCARSCVCAIVAARGRCARAAGARATGADGVPPHKGWAEKPAPKVPPPSPAPRPSLGWRSPSRCPCRRSVGPVAPCATRRGRTVQTSRTAGAGLVAAAVPRTVRAGRRTADPCRPLWFMAGRR